MPPTGDRRGATLVHKLFGVNLQQQGRGFYVSLEMFAIIRGVLDDSPDELLSPDVSVVRYRRMSHDLARRIATSSDVSPKDLADAIQGAGTRETLNALFSSLVVSVPGRRRAPKWFAAHFYPFVGELVHYDAVERRNKPAVERYVFRDGGGWAYRVLRSDLDTARRSQNRDGLKDLVQDGGTALGRVAAALRSHDAAQPTDPFTDTSERDCIIHDDVSEWPELLRRGVHHIVSRATTPRAKRVEQVMHWVPYCLARHQLRLARGFLELPVECIPVDATHEANPVRTRSQTSLDQYRWNIVEALVKTAAEGHEDAVESGDTEADRWLRYTGSTAPFVNSPRAFFSETLAAVAALNSAAGGRRHFTFKAPMLEALVAAVLPPGHEMEYHLFCKTLFEELRLVVDDRSARDAGLTDDIDEGVFVANADAFRAQLAATGLLTHYSDATSLVHGEAR